MKIIVKPHPERLKFESREVYVDGEFAGWIRQRRTNNRFMIYPDGMKQWMGNEFKTMKTAKELIGIHYANRRAQQEMVRN